MLDMARITRVVFILVQFAIVGYIPFTGDLMMRESRRVGGHPVSTLDSSYLAHLAYLGEIP